jgi:hypothetical protein
MEEVLSNGRMRKQAAVESVLHSYADVSFGELENSTEDLSEDQLLAKKQEIITKTFLAMVKERFVVPQLPPLVP